MARATPLLDIILARIGRDGPMSIGHYMELCLQHPEHGYYRRADAIGVQGDFITAPEISQIFGEIVGAWAATVWAMMGAPARFSLVELGPGRGVLMADALRAAARAPGFLAAAQLHLVESSQRLRQEQRARLAGHGPIWVESLAEVPPGPAILIANEFFDALPIRQFARAEGAWRERLVAAKGGALHIALGAALASEDAARFFLPAAAEDGEICEVRPAVGEIMAQMARLAEGGALAALIFDYGHRGEGLGDTLQAVARHRFCDPLFAPGESDLSAHVDFAALARAARTSGLTPHGPIPMGRFLLELGAAQRLQALLAGASEAQRERLLSGFRRLTAPLEMGELFKSFALTAGLAEPPPPFRD